MARGFNGTSDRIDYGTIDSTAGQAQSFSAWIYSDDAATGDERFFAEHVSGDGAYSLLVQLQNGNKIEFLVGTSGLTLKSYTDSSQFSSGSWFHYFFTWGGSLTATNVHQYINNSELSYDRQENGSGSVDTPDGSWSFGYKPLDNNIDGALAGVGWWNRVLTADERKALSKGFSPLFIPIGLKFAPDLIRDQRDAISGEAGTLDGTTVREHPRIIKPSNQIIVPLESAAAPSALGIMTTNTGYWGSI